MPRARAFHVVAAIAAAALLGHARTTPAAELHVFTAGLRGEPEIGCLVTNGAGCAGDRITGTLAPDGDSSFAGRFVFVLPGVRDDAGRLLRHRSVVVVLSDFIAEDWERPLQRLAARHDVVVITVDDPRERALPESGWIERMGYEVGSPTLEQRFGVGAWLDEGLVGSGGLLPTS